MAKLTETAEFTADVLRLDTDTPVRGFDGTDIGPSNEQAQTLANRTQWLKQKIDNLSATQVRSVNGLAGTVNLDANDVGADPAGTADSLLTAHINDTDPHLQYFNEARGDVRYVRVSSANIGGGWLQLDSSGKIPAALLQTLTSRYVVVADQAARLALPSSSNLTICAQADIDTLFYLNADDNPAVAANWVQGQAATVSGVSSVYGRTGAVTAQNGDYDADKITETATRKFATPSEKTVWNAKQATLVSGVNIRSLFGNSLLGSGNLAPTPAQMGAARAVHTHTAADITDFTQQAQTLIINSLEAGPGVTLGQNPVNGKTIISATGGGSGTGGGYIVVDRPGATAGQNHSFIFSPQSTFGLTAYALKEVAGATNQTYIIDEFNSDSEPNYSMTNAVSFNGIVNLYTGGTVDLSPTGEFYSSRVRADGESVSFSLITESLIPAMASNTQAGYVASASSVFSASFPAYVAFDRKNIAGAGDVWAPNAVPTQSAPQWLRIDMPAARAIGGYSIKNRLSGELASPRSWVLQGSNNGQTWEDIHSITNDTNNTGGSVRSYDLQPTERYLSYRLLITAANGNYNFVTVAEFELYPTAKLLIKSADGKWYSSGAGVLKEVSEPVTSGDFHKNGFIASGGILPQQLTGMLPVEVYSNDAVSITNKYTPYQQIMIQKALSSAATWGQINAAALTATQTNNGFVRVAATRDLASWYVWRGGVWTDIGVLSADTTSATKLIADGMTPSDLNGINAAGWKQFFAANNGVPDFLAFAFALDISDPASDVATIDRLTLNVNEAPGWMLQTPAQVEIRWRTDSVTFRTVTAGNYKLAYQIP